jgi:hypothetical protein
VSRETTDEQVEALKKKRRRRRKRQDFRGWVLSGHTDARPRTPRKQLGHETSKDGITSL